MTRSVISNVLLFAIGVVNAVPPNVWAPGNIISARQEGVYPCTRIFDLPKEMEKVFSGKCIFSLMEDQCYDGLTFRGAGGGSGDCPTG